MAKKTAKKKTAKKALNSQQLAFCRNVANGKNNTQSYLAAYKGVRSENAAQSAATRLLSNVMVIEKVEQLRHASETKNTLSRQEKREFIAKVLRTNVDELNNPENKHLIQERTRTMTPGGGKKEVLKMPSKMEAIKLDNLMQGDNEPEELNVNNTGTIAMSPIEFVCQNAKTLAARKKNKKS